MSSPSLSVSRAVRAHDAALTNLYLRHRETVLHIQNTLLSQILPNVLDELALGDAAHDWVQEWLQDERKSLLGSVLRPRISHRFSLNNQSVYISHPQGELDRLSVASCGPHLTLSVLTLFLQRHQFTKAFTLESLRTILTWRLTHLRDQDQTVFLPSPLHILPPPASDVLRRPILILRLAELATLQSDPREHILRSIEGLRLNLHNINSSSSRSEGPTHGPVFQYVLLVDMEGVSMRKFVRLTPNPPLMTDY